MYTRKLFTTKYPLRISQQTSSQRLFCFQKPVSTLVLKTSDIQKLKQTQIWYDTFKVKNSLPHKTNFDPLISIKCIRQTKSESKK